MTVLGFAQKGTQDYPQWRGQIRDGSASIFSESQFRPEKLTLRRKVEVREGYATPIVVGNKFYSFTQRDSNDVMIGPNTDTGQSQRCLSYLSEDRLFSV